MTERCAASRRARDGFRETYDASSHFRENRPDCRGAEISVSAGQRRGRDGLGDGLVDAGVVDQPFDQELFALFLE